MQATLSSKSYLVFFIQLGMSSFLLFEQFSIEIREYWQGTIEAGVQIVLLWFLQAIFLLLSIVLPLLLLRPFFIEDFQGVLCMA